MQRSVRANRDFPRYTGTPGRRGLAFLLLVIALLPQLLGIGAGDRFGGPAEAAGAVLHAGQTSADAAQASCEVGAPSCAAAATAAAASVAVLAPLVLVVIAATAVSRRITPAPEPRAFAPAVLARPPRASLLVR